MTEEQLARANEVKSGIDWCNSIVRHTAYNHKLTFEFRSGEIGLETVEHKSCPKWLVDIIENAVIEHRAKLYEEFAGL